MAAEDTAAGTVARATRRDADTQSGHTAWARNLAAPVRDFLATETGSAAVLLAAAVVALVWANSPWRHSYESLWTHEAVGPARRRRGRERPARLGQRRPDDVLLPRRRARGQARARRRATCASGGRVLLPMLAAIGGIAVPIAIYLSCSTPAAPGAHGWGAAMSTDTALALGALALLTPRTATRLRVFLLSFAIVDDLVALVVIATVYTKHVSMTALLVAIALFGAAARAALRPRSGAASLGAGRDRAVGRALQVGHRPGDLGPRDRARHERLPALARGSRTGDRAGALVPRAADARPGPRSPAGRARGDLAERAAPVQPPPVEQLRRRPALRARERRHLPRRRAASATRSARR